METINTISSKEKKPIMVNFWILVFNFFLLIIITSLTLFDTVEKLSTTFFILVGIFFINSFFILKQLIVLGKFLENKLENGFGINGKIGKAIIELIKTP